MRAQALVLLGLSDQDFGPCYTDNFTHKEFSAEWRGIKKCPSEQEIIAAGASFLEPVPQEITRFQAEAQLHISGLLPSVVAIMEHQDTPEITKIAWRTAQVFRRQSPIILSLAPLLNVSSQELDNLFISAKTITA